MNDVTELTDLARVRTSLRKSRHGRVLLAAEIDEVDAVVAMKLPGSLGDVARLVADDSARLLARLDGLIHRLEDAEREAAEPEPRPAA